MPKHNINYENCVIYKISCKDENCKDIYVGETCDFIRRKYAHKHQSQNKNVFLYNVIMDNGGWDNWNMEVIEKYPAKSKQEALDREQYWINTLQASLNTYIRYDPCNYKREWYFKNRETIKERIKKQEQERRDKIIKQYSVDIENPPDWYLANIKSQKHKL